MTNDRYFALYFFVARLTPADRRVIADIVLMFQRPRRRRRHARKRRDARKAA